MQFTWEQTPDRTAGINHDPSAFSMAWNSIDAPTISDPDQQLHNIATGPGNAEFEIHGDVYNSHDIWRIYGPAADTITISWHEYSSVTPIYGERISIVGAESSPSAPVPEPVTCLLVGLGLSGLVAWGRKRRT